MAPFVGDVESFELVDATGQRRLCSRTQNADLFALAVGGYGLFGVITAVTLRLVPRRKIQRVVEVRSVDGLMDAFDQRIADGFLYGDFQYAIDPRSDDFMRKGVFSCYRPVSDDTPIAAGQKDLSDTDWGALLHLAHTDGSAAFDRYASYYLSTSGQVYWSDLHQLSTYLDGYHRALDARVGGARATEMITEIYVPRPALAGFFEEVRDTFRTNGVPIVYGTVRLIERDTETFLPWARESWACTIFNLHVEHTPAGRELLPHVPSLRAARAGRGGLSALRRLSAAEAHARSGRALPERLVAALPPDVRRPPADRVTAALLDRRDAP
jgi:FAD/FMN-containing dehydrogenase